MLLSLDSLQHGAHVAAKSRGPSDAGGYPQWSGRGDGHGRKHNTRIAPPWVQINICIAQPKADRSEGSLREYMYFPDAGSP